MTGTVLQVLPRLVTGGVERGTVEVTAALAAAGWKAVVASAGGPLAEDIARAGGVPIELPLASKNPFVMYANIARLEQVIRAYNVDIVHARSRAPAWSAYYAARRTGKIFVTTFHAPYGAGSWLKRRYNSVMARGERVIAISNFVGDYAAATYGVPRGKLRVIPRGVDIAVFDPARVEAARIEALRRAWRLDDRPVIMLPGRLTRWKGALVLIEALARLGRRDVQCVLAGGGDAGFRREIEQAAARYGLGDMVKLPGDCRDMPAAYRLADVVVSPALRPEGFGRVIIEAQAMGRPVIATAHGGACETVLPGKTGWLVPPGDAAALADRVKTALGLTPEQKAGLAADSIAHIRAHFTTAKMTAATLAVYREVLSLS